MKDYVNKRENLFNRIQCSPSLPIAQKSKDILKAIREHQVVIVCGETGSGKSTQIPKICLAAGRGKSGRIACTQPRRIAAINIAHRIAEEIGEAVGRTVGYKIRFDERLSGQSRIKIMTDGILLAETPKDPFLKQYDTIIVDEAHERSVNIDFILGILRNLLKRRKDLKVIITSATLDTEKFSRAFHHAPIIEVSGRMYDVLLHYQPLDRDLEEKGELTYIDAAVQTVDDLMTHHSAGDVLVFMPTEQDIRECCDLLKGRKYNNALILPLFARLAWTDQKKVFLPTSARKIIVATNIAETSLTIPGIRFVVDTGLARSLRYNPGSGTTSLPILPISKSSAEQRKGRCGRVANGLCYRLYSEADFQTRDDFNTPEILRSNLAGIILKMLDLNLTDTHAFPFIDRPSGRAIKSGFDLLLELGAISKIKKSLPGFSHYRLTDKGRFMAKLPIDPRVARMIIEGRREKCLRELIVIASALSIQDPRDRPAEKEKQADEIHQLLRHPYSDFLTLLIIWDHYGRHLELLQTQNKMRKFCREHFLSYRRMREWQDIYHQIIDILSDDALYKDEIHAALSENGTEILDVSVIEPFSARYKSIHRAILSGYLSHIAQKKEKKAFTAVRGKEVFIFPGSSLFQKSGKWIVAADYVETSRLYARTVAEIDPEWLEELGGHLCKRAYFDPHWDPERGEVMAEMQVTLFGFIIVPRRRVAYGRIDPQECSELFLQALADNDIAHPFPFLLYNQELTDKVRKYEEKLRKRDLLAKRDKQIEFYRQRLPGILSIKTLRKYLFERGSDQFLRMTEEDLLEKPFKCEALASDFPDSITLGKITLQLSYTFDPGAENDGVTLKVPIGALIPVAHESKQWIVPGLRGKWIYGLLKSLPKMYRRNLQPIKEKAEQLAQTFDPGGTNLSYALSQQVKSLFGVDIPSSAWSPASLEDYLKLRYAVVDDQGEIICAGRDMETLFTSVEIDTVNTAFEETRLVWERNPVNGFDFNELPSQISSSSGALSNGFFFPALTAEGNTLAIRLYRDQNEADQAHSQGLVQCYAKALKDKISFFRKSLFADRELISYLDQLGEKKERIDKVVQKAVMDLFDTTARTREDYENSLLQGSPHFLSYAGQLLTRVKTVLRHVDETRMLIERLKIGNKNSKVLLTYLEKIKRELLMYVPPYFCVSYATDDFENLIRYIKALRIRLERGVLNLEKDRSKESEVNRYVAACEQILLESGVFCAPEKIAMINDLKQMIQEYRISVFAPEVKTLQPVSGKRLDELIQRIKKLK
ncbi:MAG: ATP-dependent RNA helicase HrpA [Syntrophaceae bacterium]|nr:ATP-dependent RNA helicase HrpA [Syntrophaceae bacterium]